MHLKNIRILADFISTSDQTIKSIGIICPKRFDEIKEKQFDELHKARSVLLTFPSDKETISFLL